MRLRLVVSALVMFALATPSRLSAQLKVIPTFAGLDWQQSRAFVTDSLKALGFEPHGADSSGTLKFTGYLMDYPAAIIADFAPVGLARITVVFDVPPDHIPGAYQRLAEVLTEKYGKAANLYGGQFGVGMRKAGGYRTTWPVRGAGSPKPTRDNIEEFSGVDLLAVEGKFLNLRYSGPDWPQEHKRREALKGRLF